MQQNIYMAALSKCIVLDCQISVQYNCAGQWYKLATTNSTKYSSFRHRKWTFTHRRV